MISSNLNTPMTAKDKEEKKIKKKIKKKIRKKIKIKIKIKIKKRKKNKLKISIILLDHIVLCCKNILNVHF